MKNYTFTSATIANGSTVGPTYSNMNVNGEIVSISFKNSTTAGSYQFFASGLNVEFSRHTTIISGTAAQLFYPRLQISSNLSGGALIDAGSGNYWTPTQINTPIYYVGSGVSGGRSTGEITVYYK